MSSKDASPKMQWKSTQVLSWFRLSKTQNGRNLSQNWPSPAQNRLESKYSWKFQEPMNKGKNAYVVVWAKYTLGKSCCILNFPHEEQTFLVFSRITVFVFLSTFELTALLLKSFHLHLHLHTCMKGSFAVHRPFRERNTALLTRHG